MTAEIVCKIVNHHTSTCYVVATPKGVIVAGIFVLCLCGIFYLVWRKG